jgi:hypothetical protein
MSEYLIEQNFIEMDPTTKANWVADLRSGKYRQGEGALANITDGLFCCLGVLDMDAVLAGVVSITPARRANDEVVLRFGESYTNLDEKVCRWAGLLTGDGSITSSGLLPFNDRHKNAVYLDVLNDHGFSFNQIADLIECFY